MFHNSAKSCLAPRADLLSTKNLGYLLLNFPVVGIFNDYKSNLIDLSRLRTFAKLQRGFVYQPDKNVKVRTFKGLGMVPSPLMLDGLVILTFFKCIGDFFSFLRLVEAQRFNSISLFSFIINGHLVSTTTKSFRLQDPNPSSELNSFFFSSVRKVYALQTIILKINLILNAHLKSVS